mmetsp:Transcript_10519/g.30881  ORF Transcript_10519/g.30881 Transcript_10519/m.30881 type:complete len:256 (+) Transcript_10519:352-1119(+)
MPVQGAQDLGIGLPLLHGEEAPLPVTASEDLELFRRTRPHVVDVGSMRGRVPRDTGHLGEWLPPCVPAGSQDKRLKNAPPHDHAVGLLHLLEALVHLRHEPLELLGLQPRHPRLRNDLPQPAAARELLHGRDLGAGRVAELVPDPGLELEPPGPRRGDALDVRVPRLRERGRGERPRGAVEVQRPVVPGAREFQVELRIPADGEERGQQRRGALAAMDRKGGCAREFADAADDVVEGSLHTLDRVVAQKRLEPRF